MEGEPSLACASACAVVACVAEPAASAAVNAPDNRNISRRVRDGVLIGMLFSGMAAPSDWSVLSLAEILSAARGNSVLQADASPQAHPMTGLLRAALGWLQDVGNLV
jgi:hypothetical protein